MSDSIEIKPKDPKYKEEAKILQFVANTPRVRCEFERKLDEALERLYGIKGK